MQPRFSLPVFIFEHIQERPQGSTGALRPSIKVCLKSITRAVSNRPTFHKVLQLIDCMLYRPDYPRLWISVAACMLLGDRCHFAGDCQEKKMCGCMFSLCRSRSFSINIKQPAGGFVEQAANSEAKTRALQQFRLQCCLCICKILWFDPARFPRISMAVSERSPLLSPLPATSDPSPAGCDDGEAESTGTSPFGPLTVAVLLFGERKGPACEPYRE